MLLSSRTLLGAAPKLRTRSTSLHRLPQHAQYIGFHHHLHHYHRLCRISNRSYSFKRQARPIQIPDGDPVTNYVAQLPRASNTASTAAGKMGLSNLDLMRVADAFPYQDKPSEAADYKALMSSLYTLLWTPPPLLPQDHNSSSSSSSSSSEPLILGYLRDHVVDALVAVPESIRGPVFVDRTARTIRAFQQTPNSSEAERTAVVGGVMAYWREHDTFEVLRGWRDEPWPVYGSETEVLYSVERSGAGLLGVLRHGVHMMAYTMAPPSSHQAGEGGKEEKKNPTSDMRIWVARRSSTKQTYPGMLDNTVAGGFTTGEVPFECMVREADEEASLPVELMRQWCQARGIVTYIHMTDERAGGEAGQVYPEMQWIYDIELPPDVVPTPKDGEVAGFELMSVAQVQEELAKGSFKPNCALVLLEFFVRHGILTRDNEPGYDEIVARMHRRLPLPGPHLGYYRA